jgi:uncharacterized protein (TIGR02594 family)
MTIPTKYAWLANVGTLPRMVQEGLKLLGTHETPGSANNATIIAWAKEADLGRVYTADSVPWCGLFAAIVAKRAGKAIPKAPLWALSWATFGTEAGQPRLGDILTFTRSGGGHVGIYIAEDQTAYHVLGGNQSDQVCITRIEKRRLYRARRPHYDHQPESVQPYVVAASGALSTNEA